MSYEHEWPLTVWPTRGEVERAIVGVLTAAKLDNPAVSHEAWDSDDSADGFPAGDTLPERMTITLVFHVPVAIAVDVALRLDPLADRESYLRSLRAPDGAPHYELAIDVVAPDDDEEKQPRVRVYSNTYDNRDAYGIAAVIAADLADRLEKLSAFS